ncbi:3-oxoacyl-[acyl-carrier-protein] synthase 1 [BD1-7 clade bacterium]|uniref:3-oxoacyl-[acyl-carrier-protein] synthase 1 n=1 Tax=BD1-7 clade bacterium TaxID=2029982 RepID=A0A5S9NN52_9GAMM|nr:3-oxoacyl-[acyl-carrier-protein] synthase 1 [BD1-7 clade bacterium]
MRRVVVTGMGIVSSIGNSQKDVLESLKTGKSGIQFQPEYEELAMRSRVAGMIKDLDCAAIIPRKLYRFMGDAAAYCYVAMEEAIEQSGLEAEQISHLRTGLIMGSGGASSDVIVEGAELLKTKGIRKVGPYRVTSTMTSTISACLSTAYSIKGMNATMASACATSAHCIGYGAELIQWGKQDIVFAGGGDVEHWTQSCLFDGMGALTSKFNDNPEAASRPYDADRDGFAIASGGGVIVLEEREHAIARGATILAELVGYGTASDGSDMVAPSGEGARNAMQMAREQADRPIDYINTHGTSTPVGDMIELNAIADTFADGFPPFSSTKSQTGHSLGAAGVHEAIYSVLMLQNGFMAASRNVENRDPSMGDWPLITEVTETHLDTIMSNSFGFGGTNVSLVFARA